MSRALVVASDGNPAKLNFWAKNFQRYASGEVDKVYITIGTNAPTSPAMLTSLQSICDQYKLKLVYPFYRDLAHQCDAAVHLVDEDYVGLTEDDMWFISRGVVNDRFVKLESGEYNMVAACYGDPRNITKENFDQFGERLKTEKPSDIIRPYHLWNGWLWMKTSELKKCVYNYLNVLADHAICDDVCALPKNNEKYPHKLYQNTIVTAKFWMGMNWAGFKMPVLHPDWVYTHDTDDEILSIASIALIRHAQFKIHFELNRGMHPSTLDSYFDIKTFSQPPQWGGWKDWIHCGALGGHKGIFETIKGDDNLPLMRSPFLRKNTFGTGDMGIVRNLGNLAVVKAWDRPELQEFIADYKNSMYSRIIPPQDKQVTEYASDQLVQYLT